LTVSVLLNFTQATGNNKTNRENYAATRSNGGKMRVNRDEANNRQ